MKKNKNGLLIAFFVSLSLSSFAQEKKHLTLDQAVALGLENSKNLKIDQTKIEQAEAHIIEAKNKKLPDLSISGSALALANANVDLKIAQGGGGGAAPKANSAFLGSANLSLPLFAGGRIKYGIQSAEYVLDAVRLNAENDKEAVAFTIAKAYTNLFKAEQMIEVLEENLKASRQRDSQFLKLENNGVIARNDRLKANLQTSNLELQLLDAQNNFLVANLNMDLLLGLPDETQIEVDPGFWENSNSLHDLKYYYSEAYQNRNDLQAFAKQESAASLGSKAAKAEELPTIAVTAGYVAAHVPKILTVTNAANVGLGVQYELSHLWKKNSSLLNAEAKERELAATSDLLRDQIKLEVFRDFNSSELAQKKIDVLENAQNQADENYRITKNKYDNGLATMTELLDANTAQISAHIEVTNAKADAALAQKKLLQTAGILL